MLFIWDCNLCNFTAAKVKNDLEWSADDDAHIIGWKDVDLSIEADREEVLQYKNIVDSDILLEKGSCVDM